jgi:hypothetical protein
MNVLAINILDIFFSFLSRAFNCFTSKCLFVFNHNSPFLTTLINKNKVTGKLWAITKRNCILTLRTLLII